MKKCFLNCWPNKVAVRHKLATSCVYLYVMTCAQFDQTEICMKVGTSFHHLNIRNTSMQSRVTIVFCGMGHVCKVLAFLQLVSSGMGTELYPLFEQVSD